MIIDVPQVPTTLRDIIQPSNPYGESLFLQTPVANTDVVNFGPKGECELFLDPGLSASYPAVSLASIQVCAPVAGQKLIVIFNKA